MIYSSEAIVLKSNPYGEADLIVTYLTRDYGIIDLFAKSPRKIRSRFGSSLEPFTHSRISFIGRNDKLQRIIQSDIVEPFQELRENYKLFLKLSSLIGTVTNLFPKRIRQIELFELLLETFRKLLKSQGDENYLLYFMLNGLKISGYLPELKSCGICKTPLNGENFYSRGFVLCKNCFLSENLAERDKLVYSIPKGVIKLIDTFTSWRIDQIDRIRVGESLKHQLEYFIGKHLEEVMKN